MYVCMTVWKINRVLSTKKYWKTTPILSKVMMLKLQYVTFSSVHLHAFPLPNIHIYKLKRLKDLETNIYELYATIIVYWQLKITKFNRKAHCYFLCVLNIFATLNLLCFPVLLAEPTSATSSKELLKIETLQLYLKQSIQSRWFWKKVYK